MKAEPATLLVIEIGSVAFFFLLLPLLIVLTNLRAVWRESFWTGLVLTIVVVLTGFFFALFIAGLVALTFFGA